MKSHLAILMVTFFTAAASCAIPSSDTLTNFAGLKFKRIAAGTFQMGYEGGTLPASYADPEVSHGLYNEHPRHPVVLTRDFYMGVYEVTGQQFAQFRSGSSGNTPVTGISWFSADSFCQWLTANDPNHYTYRLPTEAEWEYCCRAGTTTRFYTGDILAPTDANVVTGQALTLQNAGSYPPNPWGLYDMHGNADEWCLDWSAPYTVGPDTNPGGLVGGSPMDAVKSVRGNGRFLFWARSATRGNMAPVNTNDGPIGFRVVISDLTSDSLRYKPLPDTLPPCLKNVAASRPAPATTVSGESYTDAEGNAFKRVRMSRNLYPSQRDSVVYVSLTPITNDSAVTRPLSGAYARRLSTTHGVLYRLSNKYELLNAGITDTLNKLHLTLLPDTRFDAGSPHPDVPYYIWRKTSRIAPEDSLGGPLWYDVNHCAAIAECPNGDLLATWFTGMSEDGMELNIAASRLRLGSDTWDTETSIGIDWGTFHDDMMTYWNNGKGRLFRMKSSRRITWTVFTGFSDDNGLSWSPWTRAFGNVRALRPSYFVPLSGDTVVAIPEGYDFKLMMSVDGGYHWFQQTPSYATLNGHHVLMALDDGRLFGMSTRASIKNSDSIATMYSAVSSDKGVTWVPSPTPFKTAGAGFYGAALKLHSGRLIAVTQGISGKVIVESEDQGQTWFCRRGLGLTEGVNYMGGYMHLAQDQSGIIHLIGTRGSGTGNGDNPQISFSEEWLRRGACLAIAEWGVNTDGRVTVCPGEDPPDSALRLLSTGKNVTCSTSIEVNGWGKAMLTDGITRSVPGSMGYTSVHASVAATTQWVEIDLGMDVAFNQVVLYPRSDFIGGFPVDFTIEARTTAGVVTEVFSATNFVRPDTGSSADLPFTRITARYVRLTVTKLGIVPGDGYLLQLAEMEVYDISGGNTILEKAPNPDLAQPRLSVASNPFNPVCGILIRQPARGPVSLDVYTLAGRHLETLVAGELAAGQHKISWRAEGKATGVYLLRLRNDASVWVKRIVLAR